jgi:hypothetical protein
MKGFDAQLLLPRPQRLKVREGVCDLSRLSGWSVAGVKADPPGIDLVVAALQEVLGRPLRRRQPGAADTVAFEFALCRQGRGPESHSLATGPDGVRISGPTPRALFWAVQTLRQVIELCRGLEVPALAVEDWPVFGIRAYSDDMSRRQVSTLADLASIVSRMAAFKLNMYQPYIEDIIYVDRYPTMGLDRGRFTRDEIASLVELGRRNFVDIMPLFNSCAHQERMLARPEFHSWRFEGNPENLDPRRPEVKRFLERVYEQLFSQFPCEYFHMGLDEARGLWARPDLYVRHANWLAAMVVDAGRRPMMYHDMFVPYHAHFTKYSARWLDKLDHRIILDQWMYEADPSFLQQMTRRGFQVVISPAIHAGRCGSGQRNWRLASDFMRYSLDYPGVLGMVNTSWNGDHGTHDREINWRGLAMQAEMNWRGPGPVSRAAAVQAAFDRHFHGLHDRHLSAQLTEVVEFGCRGGRGYHSETSLPVPLSQRFGSDRQAAAEATRSIAAIRRQAAVVRKCQAATSRNREHFEHVLLGLEGMLVAAERVRRAPLVLAALRSRSTRALGRLLGSEKEMVAGLRDRHERLWLTRNKHEGLEFLDHLYRSTLSAMENLPWQVQWNDQRWRQLRSQGFEPLDLRRAASGQPQELNAIPWGQQVFDNVPWTIIDPTDNGGKSLVWTRSKRFATMPVAMQIPVRKRVRELHFLHAVHGRDAVSPGRYRIRYADGSQELVRLREGGKDGADWWMPFGHIFGGGGALRIDPRTTRLAVMTGTDQTQGHCLYHFRYRLKRPEVTVRSIAVEAGHRDASLVLAAVTINNR